MSNIFSVCTRRRKKLEKKRKKKNEHIGRTRKCRVGHMTMKNGPLFNIEERTEKISLSSCDLFL
jgi:hypothetical protein